MISRALSAVFAFWLAAFPGSATEENLSGPDRAAILGAINLKADAGGQVLNECGERVTPGFLAADLGGAVGTATLLVVEGGPNARSCYGDGPDLHLFRRDGAAFREIYAARGRVLGILPDVTNGVHDIADGGPGFSFPVWQWDGIVYAKSKREITDTEISGAGVSFLP